MKTGNDQMGGFELETTASVAEVLEFYREALTEAGFESANLGLQCYGGHGYINEWGMEQNVRDSRISTLYEGTTGIQALDLLGRYLLLHKLATGGMAEIYLAKTSGIEGFEKLVVVKCILPGYAANRAFIKMLIDEAKPL